MPDAIWLVVALVLSVLGMAWLALAKEVHWLQAMPHAVNQAKRPHKALRIAGSAALLLALMACWMADPFAMAIMVWLMFLAVGATGVALALNGCAPALRWLWPAAW